MLPERAFRSSYLVAAAKRLSRDTGDDFYWKLPAKTRVIAVWLSRAADVCHVNEKPHTLTGKEWRAAMDAQDAATDVALDAVY